MRKLSPWFLLPTTALLAVACPDPAPDPPPTAPPDDEECVEFCDNSVLHFCTEDGQPLSFDCELIAGPGNATCEEISPAFGLACTVVPGGNCFFPGSDEFGAFVALWRGQDPGCFDDALAAGIVCQEDLGPCAAAEVGTCDGPIFLSECTAAQPFFIDCESYGGMCGPGEGCLMDSGDFCDDFEFFCEDGSPCVGNLCP